MERITVNDLEMQIERLNKIAGPGYKLDRAYGGFRLQKGGRTLLNCGYTTKSDLYNRLSALIVGVEIGINKAGNIG